MIFPSPMLRHDRLDKWIFWLYHLFHLGLHKACAHHHLLHPIHQAHDNKARLLSSWIIPFREWAVSDALVLAVFKELVLQIAVRWLLQHIWPSDLLGLYCTIITNFEDVKQHCLQSFCPHVPEVNALIYHKSTLCVIPEELCVMFEQQK